MERVKIIMVGIVATKTSTLAREGMITTITVCELLWKVVLVSRLKIIDHRS